MSYCLATKLLWTACFIFVTAISYEGNYAVQFVVHFLVCFHPTSAKPLSRYGMIYLRFHQRQSHYEAKLVSPCWKYQLIHCPEEQNILISCLLGGVAGVIRLIWGSKNTDFTCVVDYDSYFISSDGLFSKWWLLMTVFVFYFVTVRTSIWRGKLMIS